MLLWESHNSDGLGKGERFSSTPWYNSMPLSSLLPSLHSHLFIGPQKSPDRDSCMHTESSSPLAHVGLSIQLNGGSKSLGARKPCSWNKPSGFHVQERSNLCKKLLDQERPCFFCSSSFWCQRRAEAKLTAVIVACYPKQAPWLSTYFALGSQVHILHAQHVIFLHSLLMSLKSKILFCGFILGGKFMTVSEVESLGAFSSHFFVIAVGLMKTFPCVVSF